MAKLQLAKTVLVLRALQLGLGVGFLVFWTWSCAAKYVVGGGAGEYFLGFFTALASLAVCAHGIWSFVRKQHLEEHTALYHNARWATDLAVVVLWLGVMLIQILVPLSPNDAERQLGGDVNSSGSDPIVVVGMGANVTELFSAITFFMTALLLALVAFKARRTGGQNGGKDEAGDITVEQGLQASQGAHVARQSGDDTDAGRLGRTEGTLVADSVQAPQAAHVVDV